LDQPEWWEWDLVFVAHVEDRMEERGFSELEMRTALHDAIDITPNRQAGRWVVSAALGGRRWTVVVEPDADEQVTYVVTAYRSS
jgi:hypothetical protein